MRLAVALIAALVTGTVSAEPEPWMKKDNPNELWVNAFVTDCPVSRDEVLEVADGVLIRSRIKPADSFYINGADGVGFGLSLSLQCVGQTSFTIDVDFLGNPNGVAVRYGILGYGSVGTFGGDKTFLLERVRGSVERAITDYLKVNFDL